MCWNDDVDDVTTGTEEDEEDTEDAETFKARNPDYGYTAFVNSANQTAYLIEDKEDFYEYTKWDAILPTGGRFGWDGREATVAFLNSEGFTEAGSVSIEGGNRDK